MIPLHEISTFSPYTTLFRSGWGLGGRAVAVVPLIALLHALQVLRFVLAAIRFADRDIVELERAADEEPVAEDRKSTRLNSSHLVISYAVFCLKKKILHQRVS